MVDDAISNKPAPLSPPRGALIAALGVFVLTLAFYLYTLQPSLSWGDGTRLQREAITGESFILAELVEVDFPPDPFPFARLGIAAWDHPLYVVMGYVLVRLLPGIHDLWLVNLISAVFGAGTVALLFWLCFAHTRSLIGSLYAALALAVAHTFWFHAATPEVYTLFAFLLLLTLIFYDRYERTGSRRALAGSAFTLGLGLSNHLLAGLAVPAMLIYLLISGSLKRRPRLEWRQVWPAALAFLAGFALYLIQLVRMLRVFPPGELLGPAMGDTFVRGLGGPAPLLLLISGLTFIGYLVAQFTPVGLALGAYGLWKGVREGSPFGRKTAAFFVVYALFGILYRVTDQFAFFFGSYLFWAMAMAVGVAHIEASLAARWRRWLALGLAALVVVMPFLYGAVPGLMRAQGITDADFGIPQVGTGVRDGLAFYFNPNKHGDDVAYRFGMELVDNLPPDALLITHWWIDTDELFVLRHFTVVEGLRPDLELVTWPREDPFAFDSRLALETIEEGLAQGRPVYLGSLSESYYAASTLVARYCVTEEHHLYRVYPEAPEGAVCLTDVQP